MKRRIQNRFDGNLKYGYLKIQILQRSKIQIPNGQNLFLHQHGFIVQCTIINY